ncbi:MAG: nuclear transport factor 2 family protein [Nocardioides sp.]|uniref:nuclear transport factor 2 family protein n=1 Tax=Nocardioides sp. TaxID=35761 RepID=UPI0032669A45
MLGTGTQHRTATRDEPLVGRYLGHVTAVNARDLRVVADYLTDDLVFDWGDVMPALEGRDAFTEFYAFAWQHFAEQLAGPTSTPTGSCFRLTSRTRSAFTGTGRTARSHPCTPVPASRSQAA